MIVALVSAAKYEEATFAKFKAEEGADLDLVFVRTPLTEVTAPMSQGYRAISVSPTDQVNSVVLEILGRCGIRLIAIRSPSAGNIDLEVAHRLGIRISRTPIISSYSVAEYAVTMMLTLNRKTHKAFGRVRDGNFSLEGLQGFEMHGKTIGIIGTGKTGALTARILRGFGCQILAYDVFENQAVKELGGRYTSLEDLLTSSHVVSLHAPLLPATRHMINRDTIARMRKGVMIINTSRGGLIESQAMVEGLESGQVGALGIDVYEGDERIFHADHSGLAFDDKVFARLMSLPNVLITGHQAALTDSSLEATMRATLASLQAQSRNAPLLYELKPEPPKH